jgi:hypothetical protein
LRIPNYLHLEKRQLEKFIFSIYIPIQKMMKKCSHFYFRRLHPLKKRDQLKKGSKSTISRESMNVG